jgi:multidrug transporter EmrE-like cation transporter
MICPDTAKKNATAADKLSFKTLLLLVITLLAGGGTMVMQKAFGILVPDGSVTTYSFLMFAFNALFMYVAYFILMLRSRVSTAKKEKGSGGPVPLSRLLIICGTFLAFAVFVINFLVTTMGKAVPSALLFSISYAISIAMTLIVGAFCYKERISLSNTIGIGLCVASIAIINFL